jgi:hypothetical protein
LVVAPAAFAAGDDYSVRIVGRLDSNTKHQSRDTFTVAFQVKTSNGAGLLGNWDCQIAYDTSVFELVSMDGSRNLSDVDIALIPGASYIGISASAGFSSVFSAHWQSMLFTALSSDGNTGFISMQALTLESDPFEFTDYTALHMVRLAFKNGKSLSDVSGDTIRLVSSSELQTLPGVASQIFLNSGTQFFQYGTISGEPNTLSAPIFDIGTGSLPALPASPPVAVLDFEYTVTDGEATITGYTGNDTEIEIPVEIDGYPVVAIEKDAFSDLSDDAIIHVPNEAIRSFVEESGFPAESIIVDEPKYGFPIGVLIAVLIVTAVLGGIILYYFKIVKPRKREEAK